MCKSENLLIKNVLEGNFQFVQSNIFMLESSSAVDVLVAICNACHKKLPSIDKSSVITLVKRVLEFITVPTDEQFEKYLQSTFHILKYFIEKKSCDGIVQLEGLVVPDFVPTNLTEAQHVLYTKIFQSVYNFITSFTQKKDEAQMKNVQTLCYLMLKFYKKLKKKDVCTKFIYNCIAGLIYCNVSPKTVAEFFQQLTSSTDLNENPQIFSVVIKNLSLVYTYLLDKKAFEIASMCYKSVVASLHKLKGKEYGLLIDIMNVVELLNPDNLKSLTRQTFLETTSVLANYQKLYKLTPELRQVCNFISCAASSLLFVYKNKELWLEFVDIHLAYYGFLYKVSCLIAKTSSNGICWCSSQSDVHGATQVLKVITSLGYLSIMNGSDVSCEYKKDILFYLESISELIKTAKVGNCSNNHDRFWSDSAKYIYNTGHSLFKKADYQMCLLYLEKFVKACFTFKGFPHDSIINKENLKHSLYMMAQAYFASNNFEKCMLFTAMSIIMCEPLKPAINLWMKAKFELCKTPQSQELQELTLVSICQKHKKDPICALAGFNLTNKQRIEALVYELRTYHSNWRSRISMAAAFKGLYEIADSELLANIFIDILGDGKTPVHDTVPGMVKETIKRIQDKQVAKKELLLAHLYFMQHRFSVKESVFKHCEEMKTAETSSRSDVPSDCYLEYKCDLVASYTALELPRYIDMMEDLLKSLSLCKFWLSKDIIDETDAESLLTLLANLGHEYCLHGLKTMSLQAWELALKLASDTKNALHRLTATGFILELADPRKPLVQKMVSEAEEEIGTLKRNQNFKELIVYFLCKADAYLYVDYKTADSAFREALLLQKDHECDGTVRAQTSLMHHKFNVVLPCRYSVEEHRQFSIVKIFDAVSCVNTRYGQAEFLTSYDTRTLFDVYENLAKWHHSLYMPRELRCYAKDATLIAQKMILPLRTMSFLYYLAYADIITNKLDHARVKIKGLSSILCLDGQATNTGEQDRDVDFLAEEFKNMVLDIPRKNPPASTNGGSPSFAAESFALPSFLTHKVTCECLYCVGLECQDFVIKTTFLKAMLSDYEDNLHLALEFFHGCLKIHERLNHREKNYARKIRANISHDLVPVVGETLMETRCAILKEYVNFLIRNKRLVEAEQINQKIVTKLESLSLQTKFVYLHQELLMQAATILLYEEEPKTTLKLVPPEIQDTLIKTPPSRQTTVQVSPNWTRTEAVKPKIFPKSIKFDLSEEDVPKSAKKAQPKEVPFLNLGTATPAPACSKIKIYTNGSTKKSKSVPAVPTPFKEPNAASTTEKRANPELALRTKLLTERLRDSSRKGSVRKTDAECGKGDSKKKASVKQNLLKQLDEADAQPKEVRRSARNKK